MTKGEYEVSDLKACYMYDVLRICRRELGSDYHFCGEPPCRCCGVLYVRDVT
ncbi:MAG: hypothetical protein P8165_07930 [Deltaproteobacteria bacterium]